MPITEPNPHVILDTLRGALGLLQAYTAKRPESVLVRVAVGSLELTIVMVAELASEAEKDTAP